MVGKETSILTMFETWYETQKAKMASKDGYEDYRDNKGGNKLFAVCSCRGRPPKDGPFCIRNPDKDTRANFYCIWYTLPNGNDTMHCNHRFPPKEKE